MQKYTLIVVGFLCSFLIQSQTINTTDLNKLFDNYELNNKAMGTISIFKNGEEVYNRSIGLALLEHNKKANELTKYRIGSITKTFTATIILQLINEGKLILNKVLSNYFPQIPNANKITIENLLYHRSGLYNITNEKDFSVWINKPRNRKEMLKKIENHTPVFNPDEKTAYSNTNYILLSYIAEELEGEKFPEILERRIVKPLKLKRTLVGKDINTNKNEAFSYYFEENKWKPITLTTNLKGPIGAGAIVSTAKEVNVFYDNLFSGNIIPEKMLKGMLTVKGGMCMGASSFNYKGLTVYGHDGGIDGFRSMAIHIPEKNLSLAFTFNGANLTSIRGVLISILDAYFKNDPTVGSKSLIQLKSEDLDTYLGVYKGTTFPPEIIITKKNNVLFAKVTSQPLFELIAIKKEVFKYDAMGIIFTFNKEEETISIKFQGREMVLKKEKSH